MNRSIVIIASLALLFGLAITVMVFKSGPSEEALKEAAPTLQATSSPLATPEPSPPPAASAAPSGGPSAAQSMEPSKSSVSSATPSQTLRPAATSATTPAASSEPAVATAAGAGGQVPSSSPAPAASSESEVLKQKATVYQGELNQLQSACRAKVDQLIGEVSASIQAEQSKDGKAFVEELQSKFLSRILQSEQDCDSRFNEILQRAEADIGAMTGGSAYLAEWRKSYARIKEEAQQAALQRLIGLMKNS